MSTRGDGVPSWRACYTRSRHEKKVRERLERAGFDVYLPLVAREREWHDRVKTVEMPLFPSYLFARFSEGRFAEILEMPGMASVVRFGESLATVPPQELENVRRLAEGFGRTGQDPERGPLPRVGERVRVTEGPFDGVEARVLERRGTDRVLLAGSETLGQGLKIEIEASMLETVDR